MNSSRMWIVCATLTAKATVFRRSPYLCQCVTMSPTSFGRSMRSASSCLDVVAGLCPHAGEIGIDRRIAARRHQDSRARSASATCGHSIIVSKMPPSPRPSPRHGVAVRPSSVASG